MFLEDKSFSIEMKLKELAYKLERFNRELQELIDDPSFSIEQRALYLEDRTNFSAQEWARLEEEKRKLHAMLQLDLSHLHDPQKSKQTTQAQSQIKSHWLFVR